MKTKDFIAISDYSAEEIGDVLKLAADLKSRLKRGESTPVLQGKTLAMVFQKPSARTRISFETGMYQLGGHALFLGPNEIGVGKRESAADVARVLSRYNDGIMARLFDHQLILDLAEYASIPVINGLTDFNHPCQVLADLLTVQEHLGTFEDRKIAYVGDGNNMVHSWLNAAAILPFQLSLGIPEGYDPDLLVYEMAKKSASQEILLSRDPAEAVKDADVIYTDVWASMGQEDEAEARKKIFMPFQVNDRLLSHAKKDVKVMHCLPAHRGDEITDSVIDGPHAIVFDEAENRLHLQKAILVALMGK